MPRQQSLRLQRLQARDSGRTRQRPTTVPRGRIAQQQLLQQREIAKKIKAAKIHNAKIQPERAEPVIKALILKEARTTIQAKIKYLEDKIERYRQKERSAKRKDQDDRARKYDDYQDEYKAELREYQKALRSDVNTMIKNYYSGHTKAHADYQRKRERASNRDSERRRDAIAKADKQHADRLAAAKEKIKGSFISGGVLFSRTGEVVHDTAGRAVTDESTKAIAAVNIVYKSQHKQGISRELKSAGLSPVVRDGKVVGFTSPVTRKSYGYTDKGIDAFNKDLRIAGKPVDIFRGMDVKAPPAFVADAALKYKYDTLAPLRAEIIKLGQTKTRAITYLQEKGIVNKAKRLLGDSYENSRAILVKTGIYNPELPEIYNDRINKRLKMDKYKSGGKINPERVLTMAEIKSALKMMNDAEKNSVKDIELLNKFERAVRDAPEEMKYSVQKQGLVELKKRGITNTVDKDGNITFDSKSLNVLGTSSTYGRYDVTSASQRAKEAKTAEEKTKAKLELKKAISRTFITTAVRAYVEFYLYGKVLKVVGKAFKGLPKNIKKMGMLTLGIGGATLYGTAKVTKYKKLKGKHGEIGEDIFIAETMGEILALGTLAAGAYATKVRTTKIYNKKQKIHHLREIKAMIEKNDYAKMKAGKGEEFTVAIGKKINNIVTIGEQNKIANTVAKTLKISKGDALAKIRTAAMYRQTTRIKSNSGSMSSAIKWLRTGKSGVGKKYLTAHRYGISFTERVGNTIKTVAIEFDLRGKKMVNLGLKVSTGKGKFVGTEVFVKARARKAVDFPEFKRTGVYVSKIIKGKNGKIMLNRNVEAQLSNIQIRQATFGNKPLSKTSRVSLNSILKRYSGETRLNKINSLLKKVYGTLGKEAKKAEFHILRLKGKNTNIFVEFGKGKGAYPTRIGILKSAIKRMKVVKVRPTKLSIKGAKMIKIKPIRKDINLVSKQAYKQSLTRKVNTLSKIKTKQAQQTQINKELNLQARRVEQVSKSIFTSQPKARMPTAPVKPIFRDAMAIMSAIALRSSSSVALSLKKASRNLSKSKVIQRTQQKQLTKTLTDLKQMQELKTALSFKTVTISPGVITVIIAVPKAPKPRKIPRQKIVKIGVPVLPKGFKARVLSKKQPTYRIVVNVRGKPVSKLPRELTKRGARDFLAYQIDNTLTRSGWLEPTGQSKRVAIVPRKMIGYYSKTSRKLRPYKIRKGKKKILVDAYIERAKYFQDTRLEKAQVARLRAKRRVKKRVVKRKPVKRRTVKKTTKRKVVRKRVARKPVRRTPVKGKPSKRKVVRRKIVKRRKTTKRKTIKRRR